MKVVVTAAIMDVFHNGHKNVLEKMRERGDWVVVILHDDLSCYRIKGKIPIQTTRHRKRNVLMAGADEVRITKSVDPAKEIEQVFAEYGGENCLFMRGDDNQNFPGQWMVEQWGVRVEYIPYTKNVSSTEIRSLLDMGEQ